MPGAWEYSIQDGTLQILSPGQSLRVSIPLISPTSGLIGSPAMGSPETKGKPALCKFKSLLIPTAPGRIVHLTSERYDSDLKVVKCKFHGDTHGGQWETEIEGELLK